MSSTGDFAPIAFAPAADDLGFLRFLQKLLTDPVAAVPALAYREPIAIRTFPGSRRAMAAFVTGPDALEDILIRRPGDFPKSLIDERVLRPAFGDSLLTADGADWRWKRRLAAPYFTPAALSAHLAGMMAPFDALAADWRKRGASGAVAVEVAGAMTRATLDVVRRVLFPDDDQVDVGTLSAAIDDYLAPVPWVVALASLKAPGWLPHPGRAKMRRGRTRMRAEVAALVSRQRARRPDTGDLCSTLLRAEDPGTGQRLGDVDLTDMLLTLIAAGHETSANGLALALHCLARQPDLQERLRAEASSLGGQAPFTPAHLAALVETEAFIRETMRLFPPAPLMARRSLETETVAGHALPPGTTIFIPIYAVHRHAQLWPAPDRFDIDRHLGARRERIARTAFLPFGAGPRICIGGAFAMMEMVGALATLLGQVRLHADGAAPLDLVHRVTLRPRHGLTLRVEALGRGA